MSVRIVGVGASAGGLQALETFFSELPDDLGVAFVVVQHLSMDHASSMAEILQRVTNLGVQRLDKHTVPEPNRVYMKMPEVEVVVEEGGLHVEPRQLPPPALYLPIDDFFFSLANSRKENAIAIILSGMGTDGSRGLKEIKSQGGLVMVQEPESAQFDGMPRAALRQNLADIVLPPGELASQLTTILRNSFRGGESQDLENLSQNELLQNLFDRIRTAVRIDFNRYRPATILRRIEKRMLIQQKPSMNEYLTEALRDESELQTLRRSFLIGVTRFFRDREAFTILREEIIPELFERSAGGEVRIWVPACSTGEEVYSIALIVREYLESVGSDRKFRIFGSDVDRSAILTAAAGVYDQAVLGDIPKEYMSKYFSRIPQGFKVRPEVKEHILFAVQNLLDDPPFIRIDLISCRNFLIYINTESQQQILSNFHFSLNPAGCLLLGPSESLGGLDKAFVAINRRWKVYQKRMGAYTGTGRAIASSMERYTVSPPTIRVISEKPIVPQPRRNPNYPSLPRPNTQVDVFARYLSEEHAPATLFVSPQYDILYLHGDLSGILRLPRYHAQLSLKSVMEDDANTLLTSGVDRVLATGNSGMYERVNVAPAGHAPQWVRVRFRTHEFENFHNTVVVLSFFPVKEEDGAAKPDTSEGAEVYSVDERLKERITELEAELLRSEQHGQRLYNELEATNEELQSSNRELLASNEEMQSTNEELQSVNEELYTVNSEFQRKNEELNQMNNDFSNLLKSTQISTIFVDNQLRIRSFTPGVGQQFDLHAGDIGRPLSAFATPFDLDIPARCREVVENHSRHDEEVRDHDGNYFLLRIRPYLTDRAEVKGAVITFVDINDLVRTRHRLIGMAKKYEAIFNNTQEVIIISSPNGRIEEINRPLAGKTRAQLVHTYLTDLIQDDRDKVKLNDALRIAYDERKVVGESIDLSTDAAAGTLYATIEVLPIDRTDGGNDDGSAMIIVHDITQVEVERQEANAIIAKFQDVLQMLEQDAGLLDLNEVIVVVNEMPTFERGSDSYKGSKLSDFLSESGLQRYRAALNRIKEGSSLEEVNYTSEELIQDDHGIKVLYRPIYGSSGNLVFINFEVVRSTAPSSD
jgi:two-component system CheB/CheR fusion protein